ncbi:MAG: CGGC domain-containing protein [Actinomycetota bacterium]|nr:CGGC domain-containing protein [Actinomycetota bacterium]MCL6093094.1 CGGC domain-containing protein [Actinomycetota bacterium]MDA8167424.1 CGGC domain-containing protein [Actinomycetota bacterium]
MARIGIITCSNATQDLGCSSVSCLHDLRKRKGAFERYCGDELDLIGIINCAGCPTLAAPEKILQRIRALTEFGLDAIHFTYCIDALCPFKTKYYTLLKESFPHIEMIIGTHAPQMTHEEFRKEVKEVLCHPRESMVDIIKGRKK